MTDPATFTMPFGRFKGRALADVPGPYLRWVLANVEALHDDTRQTITAYLGQPKPRRTKNTAEGAAATCARCGLPGTTARPLVHQTCATDDVPF